MAVDTFRGRLPAGLLYDPQTDMWVRGEADGSIVVGATSFGVFLAGEIISFTPKPVGAEVTAARGLGTVETGKTVLAVRAPVSLRILAVNEAAEMRPDLINADPYAAGWMLRAVALDWDGERPRLVAVEAYRRHCLAVDPGAVIVE